MSNEKEIRTKIASITNTQKITKAMEMVAASKMRRAQERMAVSRPYAQKMRAVVGHVASANVEYRHPYLIEREQVKSVGAIVISTDRGLCGGLNINLFKSALTALKEWRDRGAEVCLMAVGNKAINFFKRIYRIEAQISHLGDVPRIDAIIGPVRVMLDAYTDGKIDRLLLVENSFVSTMSQQPQVSQLVPVQAQASEHEVEQHWDYIYEPDARLVFEALVDRYIESQIYQAVIENIACEMAARMVAMKSASDNAANLIDDLQLAYNKARQAAITQEISEIVGGAAAV